MMKNVYSVGQVNNYIKRMFAEDFLLKQVSIKGEVSNCKYHSSGHIYFTLKDKDGALSAVMTLPMASALQGTGKGTISTDTFTVNMQGILGLLASHIYPYENVYDTFCNIGFMFMFVGISTLILVVAYFFMKGVSARKKIGNAFLIAIMWVSMLVNALHIAWHGFGEPMGVMHRFAFIYSFILLKIAYEAFCEIWNVHY